MQLTLTQLNRMQTAKKGKGMVEGKGIEAGNRKGRWGEE
jgi:hypothetical protein